MITDEQQPYFTKEEWINYIHGLQDTICIALEDEDARASFHEDLWERPEGGGGRTRVMSLGNIFEKAGVNTSVVEGLVTEAMEKQLGISGHSWFACGLSLVLHPENPFIPTVHANWRMFELYDDTGLVIDRWFGGGTDLTPYYLFEEDVVHFHSTLKKAIDQFGPSLYSKYKNQCDQYFVNSHRNNEMRGVGGVFYDYLKPDKDLTVNDLFAFQKANGNSFIEAYIPIVQKRKALEWTGEQRYWQEIRRGRYVEFNLIHDRGTIFGLKTNGRTESILMSLPPRVRFDYDYQPVSGSAEETLLKVCQHPRDWIAL